MLRLGTLGKLARGGLGVDEISTIFEAMGLDVVFSPLSPIDYRAAFGRAGEAAAIPGARVLQIAGSDKDGERIDALLVLTPSPKKAGAPLLKSLDSAPRAL